MQLADKEGLLPATNLTRSSDRPSFQHGIAVGQHAKQAQAELAKVMNKYQVTEVAMPDVSSKAAAQKSLGMDMDAFEAEKETFLKERASKEWPVYKN